MEFGSSNWEFVDVVLSLWPAAFVLAMIATIILDLGK